MEADVSYTPERLDHLGIVAGVCREIGLAEWLDEQAERSRQQVSVGTATVAMVLNGLGFSNRRLYLVPQFFENKPVERLLGEGVKACDLNDDCLGRTLDRLYEHDVTRLFAGIARRARKVFDVGKRRVHVDTTSFCVSGEYGNDDGDDDDDSSQGEEETSSEALISITHGYSRDHRADLKQWMLALATTHEGDIPLFLKPLDGNSSDKATLVGAIEALKEQLRGSDDEDEASIFVADGGLYSEANMSRLAEAEVRWVSRVPETSEKARSIIDPDAPDWRSSADGRLRWYRREVSFGDPEQEGSERSERWVVVSSRASEERARKTLSRKMERERELWESVLRRLTAREFACEADARGALTEQIGRLPAYFEVEATLEGTPRYAKRGRPKKGQEPAATSWRIEGKLSVSEQKVEREWRRRACYIVGTNVLDPEILSEEELIATYKGQGSVERGFRFLKDPLFLASSVFVKKPERLMALGFVMVVCLLVYRLAEHRLRMRLSETGQSIPNQVGKPTSRPTMRWVFQLFEGIELLIIRSARSVSQRVLRLEPVHERILRLLGPTFQKIYGVPS